KFNKISDISSLKNIQKIVKLDLDNNQISDISPLKKMLELKELTLSENNIKDLSTITSIKKLKKLDLSKNLITNIPSFNSLSRLLTLNLSFNKILNFEGLKDVSNLEELFISNNNISLLPNMQDVPLKLVDLSNNNISKILELTKLPKMSFEGLITENNPVTNEAYSFREPPTAVLDVKVLTSVLKKIIGLFHSDKSGMIGIFGRWGRGKTFLWKNLRKELDENNYKTIEFSAWKYNDTPASWAYLYETIAKSFYDKPTFWRPFKIFFLKLKKDFLATILNLFITLVLPIFLYFTLRDNFDKISGSWEFVKGFEMQIGFGMTYILVLIYYFSKFYKLNLSNIIKQISNNKFIDLMGMQAEIEKELTFIIKSYPQKIVLFVDDLDRCDEEKILQIIDSLRLIIENKEISEKLVVIAAIDERISKKVIRNKYSNLIEDNEELNKMVKEYLEKLFAFGVKLPALSEDQIKQVTENVIKSVFYHSTISLKTGAEYPILHDYLPKIEEITPRQITSAYNRFIFAVNLLTKKTKNVSASDKELIFALIIYFSFVDDIKNINSFIKKNKKFADNKIICTVFDKEIEVNKSKFGIILEIIKTTVAF
ncbi:MAG: P-loop NTPase fold protein, partial [Bacteroidota bacterium]|nr:P-loop NTPase fold protein [Bacteroidota bacterium]